MEGLELNDEAYKVFFSTVGTEGEISDNLRELLRYMNNTRDYPAAETNVDLICKIENAVGLARKDDDWRHAYMTYQIHQRDAELRGEAKGKAEGEASILTLMQKLFTAGRVQDAERALNDKAYCNQLLIEYGLAK